ncbi:MAG: hypothetical protein QG577_2699 [Thermodesulfobacteriota bacterium]|nr:hypothetical protein [Thermodesulfobacteriota bacterium]
MELQKTIIGDLKTRMDRILTLIAIFWTVVIVGAFAWDYRETYSTAMTIAKSGLKDSFNKDTVYRRWASIHGGVYVPVTDDMPPNPYLVHVPERDVTTTTGKQFTLINPAYMTRQVHELGEKQYGHKGHITSLNPLRPENRPDDWEIVVLRKFEQGQDEVCSLDPIGDVTYLRFMRPFVVEEGCLKCHGHQGYKVGDIRGGISISTPWKPVEQAVFEIIRLKAISYSGIWFIGIVGLLLVRRNIRDDLSERERAEKEKSHLTNELQNSLAEVKKLSGFLPICSSCKKIRDDKGYWSEVERYIGEHSEAQFSHGICPDCMRKLYPEIADDVLGRLEKEEKE